jgi:HK97 gp10 family phage protein
VSVKVTGMKDFKRAMSKLGDGFDDAVDQGVFITAEEVRSFAIKSIQEQSSGQQVKRSRQGGGSYTHTAAAIGQAPNTDTGKLVASIASEKVGDSTYHVGSNLDYAEFLEFGTTKMGARPWLHPAMITKQDNLISNISKVVDVHIERLTR